MTIQSQLAYGYAGNNLAILAMQLNGFDPIQIPTVFYSNHLEYDVVKGIKMNGYFLKQILCGILKNNLLADESYIVSGFCNSVSVVEFIADVVKSYKKNSHVKYIYDPAFGDFRAGGLYIAKEVVSVALKELIPIADIITPNQYELEYILGIKIVNPETLLHVIKNHTELSSKIIIITSVNFDNTPNDRIDVVLYSQYTLKIFYTPKINIDLVGCGDLFTALLVCQLKLNGSNIDKAIECVNKYIHQVMLFIYTNNMSGFTAQVLLKYRSILYEEQQLEEVFDEPRNNNKH